MKIIGLAGFLFGCSPSLEGFSDPYQCPKLIFKDFQLESPRDCDCLSKNVIEDGMKALYDSGIVSEGHDFSDLSIRFYNESTLDEDLGNDTEGTSLYGRYFPSLKTIALTRNGESFVHEMLHYWENEVLGVSEEDSANHKNWDIKGYNKLDERFFLEHNILGPDESSFLYCP